MQAEATAIPKSQTEIIPQLLLELPTNDARLKFNTEEVKISVERPFPLYFATSSSFCSFQQFLEGLKSKSSFSCKLVHIELSFNQPILLEQLILQRTMPLTNGALCHVVALTALRAEEKEHPQYFLVPLNAPQSHDNKTLPAVSLSRDSQALHINCAAYTQSLQVTIAIIPELESPNKVTFESPKELNENLEFDKEVELISKRNAEACKPEIKKPTKDYANLPRYYKDNWSPERGSNVMSGALQENEKFNSNAIKPAKMMGQELSPIKKEVSLDNLYEETDEAVKIFQQCFSKIVIRGLTSQQMPPSSYTIQLLNMRSLLEGHKIKEWQAEVEYLTALSLISGRKFVQASEILRKLEAQILKSLELEPSQHRGNVSSKYMKAAIIEILIADCMNQHFQLFEKLQAFKRATDLFLGVKILPAGISAPSKYSSEDIYTFLVKMHPNLARLLLSMLAEKSEAHRVSAMRCLDFLIENMGCSLGTFAVQILKAILSTYPCSNLSQLHFDSVNSSMVSVASNLPNLQGPEASVNIPFQTRKEEFKMRDTTEIAAGTIIVGSQNTERLAPLYNHLLETFLNVLSSISSQILHKIIYEIILPYAYAQEVTLELRCVLLSIADKILSICQGDLILTSAFLSGVLKDQGCSNKKIASVAQAVWQTIRTKICPNCSAKSKKRIVAWLIENFVGLAEKVNSHPGSRETAEEDAALRLGAYIDIACILTSGLQTEGDQNSLVLKNSVPDKSDIYELITPLLYWLNFTLASEGRAELFKQVWQCTSNLLLNMKETINFDVNSLIIPLLNTVKDHCKHSSPTVPMLRFLGTVLKDFNDFNADMRKFLVELTESVCSHMPNFPHEEIFGTFDLLIDKVFCHLPEPLFINLISWIMDKYTIKSKKQQESVQRFVKAILTNSVKNGEVDRAHNFFGIVLDICMFNNKDVDPAEERKDGKKTVRMHEIFIEKLNFLLETLKGLNENHMALFGYIISQHGLEGSLLELLNNGHSFVRLKVYEILEILCNLYTNCKKPSYKRSEEDIVKRQQLLLGRLALIIAKKSLSASADSYMQFYSLILLDLTFQRILPVPSCTAEMQSGKQKSPSKVSKADILDLESADPSQLTTDFEVTDYRYLHLRMLATLKIWNYAKNALNSPWSNIRSITYGLMCSMFKVNVQDYRSSFKDKLKSALLPVFVNLLSSKESESKAGGLNILGSFCGLSYDVDNYASTKEQMSFFKRNSDFVSLAIWQLVFDLQEDWDATIKEAATVLIQFSAPRESILHFHRIKSESKKLKLNCLAGKYGNICMAAATKMITLNNANVEGDTSSVMELLEVMGRVSEVAGNNEIGHEDNAMPLIKENLYEFSESGDSSLIKQSEDLAELAEEEKNIFFVDKYSNDQIKEIISIFKNDFKPPKNLWIEHQFIDPVDECEYEIEDIAPMLTKASPSGNKPLANELPLAENASRKFHMIDILEDKLIGPNRSSGAEVRQPESHSKNTAATRKEDSKGNDKEQIARKSDSLDAEPYKFFPNEEDINQADLDIIELEDEDFLGNLEEDKVPVIKNTYADKKNKRPTAPKPGSKIAKVKIDLTMPTNKSPIETRTQPQPQPQAGIKTKDQTVPEIITPPKNVDTTTSTKAKEMPVIAPVEVKQINKESKEDTKMPQKDRISIGETPKGTSNNNDNSATADASNKLTITVKPVVKGLEENRKSIPEKTAHQKPAATVRESVKETSATTRKDNKSQGAKVALSSSRKSEVKEKLKTNQSFMGDTKKRKRAKANKSFEHYHTSRAISNQSVPSRSCLKNLQISSPSDPIRLFQVLLTPKRDRKGKKKEKEKEFDETMDPNTGSNMYGHHSSSLPASPRIEPNNSGGKVMQSPDASTFLKDLKFSARKKDKHKRQPQQNFAQTSPALAAILRNLRAASCKEGNDQGAKSYKTENKTDRSYIVNPPKAAKKENFEKQVVSQAKKMAGVKMISGRQKALVTSGDVAEKKRHKREPESKRKQTTNKVRIKNKLAMQGQDVQSYRPIQAINISTGQIDYRNQEEDRDITPIRNNYIDDSSAQDSNQEVNQTY